MFVVLDREHISVVVGIVIQSMPFADATVGVLGRNAVENIKVSGQPHKAESAIRNRRHPNSHTFPGRQQDVCMDSTPRCYRGTDFVKGKMDYLCTSDML